MSWILKKLYGEAIVWGIKDPEESVKYLRRRTKLEG